MYQKKDDAGKSKWKTFNHTIPAIYFWYIFLIKTIYINLPYRYFCDRNNIQLTDKYIK